VEIKEVDLKGKKAGERVEGMIRLTLIKQVNFLNVKTHYCPELNRGSMPGTLHPKVDA